MLRTIGAISVNQSNYQESAEEYVMYYMNHIMHQLISSVQKYAAPPLANTVGAVGARVRVSEV